RAQYDQFGHASADMSGFGGGGGGFSFGGFDFSDILNEMTGFGGGRRRRGPAPGNDVELTLQIDFEEAIFGVEKQIEFSLKDACEDCRGSGAKAGTTPVSCGTCGGSGQVVTPIQTAFGMMQTQSACRTCRGQGMIIKDPCDTCRGQGRVNKKKKLAVNIPKGIDNGESIRYTGQGEAGGAGAPKGNLYVKIMVRPHKVFTRRGANLYMNREISFTQAALGAEIIIDTPHGEEVHRLAAGTQPESVITLRGKGVPVLQSSRMGDLIVTLKVVVPRNLTDSQKELLRQFAAESGDAVDNGKKSFFDRFKK
ncbi:MAG: J domain-containing protein, partial [Defluviitaleaceae bacterium]|nr:J domain-containing protein [Defluviitaleaceae bacterium]